jgi:hypothetical protein
MEESPSQEKQKLRNERPRRDIYGVRCLVTLIGPLEVVMIFHMHYGRGQLEPSYRKIEMN